MPCPFTGPKMFCAGKNLIPFSASSKTFVPAQKQNLLNGNHLLVWHKMFGTGTKCISIFGLAQNILKPVKGQGIGSRRQLKYGTKSRTFRPYSIFLCTYHLF